MVSDVFGIFISAVSFECDTGNIDVVNDGFSPGNDAYFHANVIYDSFMSAYKIPL